MSNEVLKAEYIEQYKSDLYCKYGIKTEEGFEPEVLHIIKSGFEGMFLVFYENAYGTEPWQNGVKFLSKEEILEIYKIEL